MRRRPFAALVLLALAAAACAPKSETASSEPAAMDAAAPPIADWRARLEEDAAILRAQLDDEHPNVPEGAQAAARIARLAAEISAASADGPIVEAADAFERDAVSLAALYPRQYEIDELHELIGDFLDKADAFESVWLAAPSADGGDTPAS